MTLPTGSLSAQQIVDELRVVNPGRVRAISLQEADVRALAGVPSGPISFNDLRGKTSYVAMSGSVPNVSDYATISTGNYDFPVDIVVLRAGGLAPFSYTWTKLSGSAAGTLTAANAADTTAVFGINRFAESGTVLTMEAQCVVTDATGATLTRSGTITITLE